MDPLIKEWIKALRSGKYKQGVGYLCCDGRYCCLGVLCDIAGLKRRHTGVNIITFDNERQFLPPSLYGKVRQKYETKEILESCNLSPSQEVMLQESEHWILTDLNDKIQLSFNQIADLIEKDYVRINTKPR